MEEFIRNRTSAAKIPLNLEQLTAPSNLMTGIKAMQQDNEFSEYSNQRMRYVNFLKEDEEEPAIPKKYIRAMAELCGNLLTTYRRPALTSSEYDFLKADFAKMRKNSVRKKILNEDLDQLLYVLRNEAGLPVDNFAELKKAVFHVPYHAILADSLDYKPNAADAAFTQRVYRKYFRDIWSFAYDTFYFTREEVPAVIENEESISEPPKLFFNIHALLLLVELRLNSYVLGEKTKLADKEEPVQSRAELRAEAKKLKAAYETEVESLNKELKGKTTALNSAQSTINSFQKSAKADAHRISELEREVEELKKKLNGTENETPVKEPATIRESPVDGNETRKKLTLPNTGRIWFIGGHQNMTKKLKQLYPEWHYISMENVKEMERFTCNVPRCDCIIFYTAHVSHPLYNVFADNCPKGCCVLHCSSSTNLDRLMLELEDDWNHQGCPVIGD